MIRKINDVNEHLTWLGEYVYDDCFSSPFCDEERVKTSFKQDNHVILGVFKEEKLTGLFCLIITAEEKSLETKFMYSKDKDTYDEFMDYLSNNYNDYEVWFVFNPKNKFIKDCLLSRKAYFYTEQRFMEYQGAELSDVDDVFPYCENYKDEYIALHSNDGYWNGEKVLDKKEDFDIFICVKDGKLVGYIDLSKGEKLVEIMDLMILTEYRNKGIGALLLQKAISFVKNKQLILTVDVDNDPANHLYERLGFKEILANNSVTARYTFNNEQ